MRGVPEWIGLSDDSQVPPRVRLRVWALYDGRCHKCTRKIQTGEPWTCEHLIALCNGGANREKNLGLTCKNCLPVKNASDVAEKSKVARIRKRHLGIRTRSRFACSKSSPFKKKLDGRVVKR